MKSSLSRYEAYCRMYDNVRSNIKKINVYMTEKYTEHEFNIIYKAVVDNHLTNKGTVIQFIVYNQKKTLPIFDLVAKISEKNDENS